jgi:hypothetical protein
MNSKFERALIYCYDAVTHGEKPWADDIRTIGLTLGVVIHLMDDDQKAQYIKGLYDGYMYAKRSKR